MGGYFITPTPHENFAPYTRFDLGVHDEALTLDECDLLRKLGERQGFNEVALRRDDSPEAVDTSRFSVDQHIVPLDDESLPVVDRISYAVVGANRYWWNFDITQFSELSVLRYREGHEYTLHTDLSELRPLVKLAIVILLSDPSEFEGGILEYQSGNEFVPIPMKKGTIVVYPSYLPHRVTKIESGERWSLVAWVEGPPFR